MKLYIIVNAELEAGLQMAQACHALSEFEERNPAEYRHWKQSSNNIVIASAPNELALLKLFGDAGARGVPRAIFVEPDLAGAVTSTAILGRPEALPLVSCLPLALRPRKAA
jgi:hypothetical protein